MKGFIGIRKPVGTAAALDTSVTSVTNAAYVQLQASTASACSALIVTNGGAQALAIALGAPGSEKLTGAVIPPGAGQVIIPIEIPKASRVSLISLGSTQSTGIVTMSSFV